MLALRFLERRRLRLEEGNWGYSLEINPSPRQADDTASADTTQAIYGRSRPAERARISEDTISPNTITSLHSQSVSRHPSEMDDSRAALLAAADTPLFQGISSRFAFLQSRLQKQAPSTERGAGVETSDAENSQHSRRRATKRRLVTRLAGVILQYGVFIGSQELIQRYDPSHSLRNPTLGEFLLEGPPIRGNFDHDLWIPYTHAVKELLLDPGSRDWLDEDLETFLDRVELMGSVELDEAFRVAVEHRYTERNDRNNYNEQQDDEEAQIEEDPDEQERNDNDDPDNNPRQSTNPWHHIRPFIFVKLLPALGTAVCIFHITAMLGYVLLMNDPAPPNPSFIAGTLLTWFLTAGMMIGYGIVNAGSVKE
ncbi:hypothetical protein BGZ57DRAFT_912027 [Hyaloscypha finlandica]|nr:hypothetical protein BGZ57DRAFT_912027 [Hyaloscypha finlandica]